MHRFNIFFIVLMMFFTVNGKTHLCSDGSLELPVVPTDLKQPKDRADYVVGHFWDAMDWTDTAVGRNHVWLEQQLVNYLSVLPYAGVDSVAKYVNNLVISAQADRPTFELLDELAASYLFNSDSPMRNDEFYIMFLKSKINAPLLSDSTRERAIWMLDELNKNRVGQPAADFRFTTVDGRSITLSEIKSDKDILLIFYDPDCSTCHDIMNDLKSNSRNVSIVAICVEGDRDTWQKDARTLPSQWIVGYPDDSIDELYALFDMPTMLLLSPDRVVKHTAVLLKNL